MTHSAAAAAASLKTSALTGELTSNSGVPISNFSAEPIRAQRGPNPGSRSPDPDVVLTYPDLLRHSGREEEVRPFVFIQVDCGRGAGVPETWTPADLTTAGRRARSLLQSGSL